MTSAGSSTVGAFGGSGTSGAGVVRNGVGDYTVTFTGSYPATINAGALVVLASAQGNLQEASVAVRTVTTTSISVEVFTFQYEADAGDVNVDDNCSVTVELGQ